MRFILALLVLLSASLVSPAYADNTSEKREIVSRLQGQLANLKIQKANLDASKATLDAEEKSIVAMDAFLVPQLDALDKRVAAIDSEDARYGNEVTAHNARCGGTYEDEGYVRQCNNKKADLDAWQSALQGRISTFDRDRQTIIPQLESLDKRDTALQQARVQNDKQRALVAENMTSVQKSISIMSLDDSFLKDPRARNARSQECLSLSLEEMAQCMQSVFDGAPKLR
jgi:chromosome segregation ATPase